MGFWSKKKAETVPADLATAERIAKAADAWKDARRRLKYVEDELQIYNTLLAERQHDLEAAHKAEQEARSAFAEATRG